MTDAVTIYGIRNCDTMKKARAWLDARGVQHRFHDYRSDGVDADRLSGWVRSFGWETVLNRAGTTFRNLSDAEKSGLDEARAIALMVSLPSLIKRPVLERGGDVIIGFKPQVYEAAAIASWT